MGRSRRVSGTDSSISSWATLTIVSLRSMVSCGSWPSANAAGPSCVDGFIGTER